MFSSAAIPNRPPTKEFDAFLQDFFENYVAQRYPSHFEKLGRKQDFLKEFLSTAIFNADLNGDELSSSSAYRYLDFDLHDAKKIEGRKANVLWLFKQYIGELEQQDKKPDWVYSYVDPLVTPFQPKTRWKSFKIFDLKAALPPQTTPTVPAEDVDPEPAPAIEPEVTTTERILSKLKYSPSFVRSTAISVLLGGVSRFALVSACSTVGLGLIPAAFIAGMGVGFVTSTYKNRENIKEEMSRETGFWRKTSAFVKGSFKSQGFYHLLFNGVAAGFGVWGADAIADLWCGNQELTEALGDAQEENLRLGKELEGANHEIDELKDNLAEAEEINKGLVDENSELKRELESVNSENLRLQEELEEARTGCESTCEKPIDKSAVIEPEVEPEPAFDHSKVINAGAFLNGVAGDDLNLVRSFIQSAGEFGGVDSGLISSVEAKLADESVRFIVTEDSAKVVMAYSAELKAGLIDGSVTQAEYSSALTKLFEQLSVAGFVASGDRLSDITSKATAIAANQNVFEQLAPKAG